MKQISEQPQKEQTNIRNDSRKTRLKKYIDKRKAQRQNHQKDQQEVYILNSKKEIQKLKNREAAQKARDKVKQKQQRLEEENRTLRKRIQQLESKQNICSSCHKHMLEEQPQILILQDQLPFIYQNDQHLESWEFQRVHNTGKGCINPFLTIFFIAVCILGNTVVQNDITIQTHQHSHKFMQYVVFPSSDAFNPNSYSKYRLSLKRSLLQSYTLNKSSQQKSIKKPNLQTQNSTNLMISRVSIRKCKTKSNQDFNQTCYVSNSTIACIQRIGNHTNSTAKNTSDFKSIQSTSKGSISRDVLFCELPRIYRSKNTPNKLIDSEFSLMIDGNFLKNIRIGQQELMGSNQSFSGFYQVSVKIESIRIVNRSNCNLSYFQC